MRDQVEKSAVEPVRFIQNSCLDCHLPQKLPFKGVCDMGTVRIPKYVFVFEPLLINFECNNAGTDSCACQRVICKD